MTSLHLYFQSHPGGFLFTKLGSSPTALFDLAFPVMLDTCFPLLDLSLQHVYSLYVLSEPCVCSNYSILRKMILYFVFGSVI